MSESYILEHHGIKGQKWGVRRYQNEDGTLTEAGKARLAKDEFSVQSKLDSVTSGAFKGQMSFRYIIDSKIAERSVKDFIGKWGDEKIGSESVQKAAKKGRKLAESMEQDIRTYSTNIQKNYGQILRGRKWSQVNSVDKAAIETIYESRKHVLSLRIKGERDPNKIEAISRSMDQLKRQKQWMQEGW